MRAAMGYDASSMDETNRSAESPARVVLTLLEQQVLAEIASGSTNEEIAERLSYSPSYVKDVVASARERLGARDRAHAAALAVELGIIRRGSDGRFVSSA